MASKGKMQSLKMLTKMVITTALIGGVALYVGTPEASAAKEALNKVGISPGNLGSDTGGLFASLKNIVYLIMGIGGLWSVAWIVIGGMLLSGSGSNAQKRSGGLAAIAVAAIGVFVIYKANDYIANWAVGLG
jgi:hypothetical protein